MGLTQALQVLLIGGIDMAVIVKGSGLPRNQSTGAIEPGLEEFFQIPPGFPMHPLTLVDQKLSQCVLQSVKLQQQFKAPDHRSQIGSHTIAGSITLELALLQLFQKGLGITA